MSSPTASTMWPDMAQLSALQQVGFNNAVYLSERQTADRNFALGYFMREHGAFPEGTDLVETLEFYFQCCSIESTREDGGGRGDVGQRRRQPADRERVFTPEHRAALPVADVLVRDVRLLRRVRVHASGCRPRAASPAA